MWHAIHVFSIEVYMSYSDILDLPEIEFSVIEAQLSASDTPFLLHSLFIKAFHA